MCTMSLTKTHWDIRNKFYLIHIKHEYNYKKKWGSAGVGHFWGNI